MKTRSDNHTSLRTYKWIPELEVGSLLLISAIIAYLLAPVISRITIQGSFFWQNMGDQLVSPTNWAYLAMMVVWYLLIGWALKRMNTRLFTLQLKFSFEHVIDLDQIKQQPINRENRQTLERLLDRHEHLPEMHGLMRFLFNTLFLFVMPLMALTTPVLQGPPIERTIILIATSAVILAVIFLLLSLRIELDKDAQTFIQDVTQDKPTFFKDKESSTS
ncbi:hypothetical protein [Hydrogenovibrio halophilus]|uniref:hypothetical protein n=1 Tax=Hydrogenovibrio halophilus TaxID=373391 RepID=UPI000370B9C8|nr:hypothetical protein [Hydrogenovibrio halophilus]